ncbi:MAG: PKD domain-containing protein [Saprospiraceae bacterium]
MKKWFTLSLLFFFFIKMDAYHIIGGDISYQCLGNDRYRFTMKIYRDCSDPRGDQFDSRAPVTVYLGNGEPYTQFLHEYVSIRPNIRNIPADNGNPCLQVPSGICVQEGIYLFELTLPRSTMSYHIVYQRCCRNATIQNIQRPDDIGATFAIEITPYAQEVCNSSPVFNNFPPVVICNNEPLGFDHSAFDLDGDQIVYEFCSPLVGGGSGFGSGANDCDGFRPDPACPPPFMNVNFVSPTYSAAQPMAGNPIISINASTGLITGTPKLLGQFVVGVCATEYRNGRPLSRIRRDFQFNVANCQPTVVARMESDEVLSSDSFLIKSCGENLIQINNQSFQRNFINDYLWEFEINGQTITDNNWSPTIDFPGPNTYFGKLLLNPNSNCGDTAYVEIRVFPELTADFSFEYDTCISGPVTFTNLSQVDNTDIDIHNWSFGDAQFSSERSPKHIYRDPGNLPVNLTVIDENGCEDEISKLVSYFPVPNLIIISPSDFIGCNPGKIFFNNLSFPIDETYQIRWDFGDGNFSDEISPTHIFNTDGIFDVKVDITSPIGCRTDTTFANLIEIQASPVADFNFSPSYLSRLNNTVYFTDQSLNSIAREWLFDNETRTTELNPVVTFRDTGLHEVRLVVRHEQGCKDTLYRYLDVIPDVTFFLPTAFSPNNDSQNDEFTGVGIMDGVKEFQLNIWNRWGELIFQTTDPREGWNGLKNNSGRAVPAGVYVVQVKYKEPRGKLVEQQGTVTVVR